MWSVPAERERLTALVRSVAPVSDNVAAYDRGAAERHWIRLERFLGEAMG